MDAAITDFVTRCELTVTSDMVAPISKGEIIGRLKYLDQSGKEITALLVADRTIEAQPPRMELTDIFPVLTYFENPLVVLLAAVLILLIILLVVAGIVRSARSFNRDCTKTSNHRSTRSRKRLHALSGALQFVPHFAHFRGELTERRQRCLDFLLFGVQCLLLGFRFDDFPLKFAVLLGVFIDVLRVKFLLRLLQKFQFFRAFFDFFAKDLEFLLKELCIPRIEFQRTVYVF
jgi:hypothetical protein